MAFRQLFLSLALLYFLAFYVMPIAAIWIRGGGVLIGQRSLTVEEDRLIWSFALGLLFWFSFWITFRFLFKRTKLQASPKRTYKKLRLKILVVAFGLIYSAFAIASIDAERVYAVRQGLEQGSRLGLLAAIFIGNFGVLIVIKLEEAGLKLLAFAGLGGMIFVSLIGGGSRYTLLILLIMVVVTFVRFRFNLLYMVIGVAAMVFSLPIILNLKSVIFMIGAGDGIGAVDFGAFYDLSKIIDLYLSNFSHPLLSIVYVDQTIDRIGYRYFFDYIQGFLFFFRMFGVDFGDSLAFYNTETLIGVRRSIIPPGYIAFGYIQFHFLGVLFSGIFYAWVGYVCYYFFMKIAPNSEMAKYYFALTAANTFYHGEVRLIVMNVFFGIFFMWLFYIFLIRSRFSTR